MMKDGQMIYEAPMKFERVWDVYFDDTHDMIYLYKASIVIKRLNNLYVEKRESYNKVIRRKSHDIS